MESTNEKFVMPSSICRICHRRLTEETSVKLGIGPVCRAEKICDEKDNKQGELFMVEAIEGFNEDIVCRRDADGIHTNVPRRITYHSPDGFEWGYGGSGPSDFALNILSIFLGQEKAWQYHQDFKWKFISTLPREGGTIRQADILSWIKEHIDA
jgi:hypothetical protein